MKMQGQQHFFRGQRVLCLTLVATALTGTGCSSRVIVAGEDQVAPPGRTVRIAAKVRQRSIFLKEVEHQPLAFALVSAPAPTRLTPVNNGLTSEEGEAMAGLDLPAEGLYKITARYVGNHRYLPDDDEILVLAVKASKPVLVLDLDNTLTNETWLHREGVEPYDANTVRVVQALARRYAIVYLSARPRPLHKHTRVWLAEKGFPEGPILLWAVESMKQLRPARYKLELLLALRRAGVNLAVGVSNTQGDIEAYQAAGMRGILLSKKVEVPGADVVRNWLEIDGLLLGKGP